MKGLSLHCLFVKIKLPGFCTCLCWGATFTAEYSALFSLLLLEIPGRLRVRCKFQWQRPLVLSFTLILFCIYYRDNFFKQIPSLHILVEKKQFWNRLIRDINLSLWFNPSKYWRKKLTCYASRGLSVYCFGLCVVTLLFAGFDSINNS